MMLLRRIISEISMIGSTTFYLITILIFVSINVDISMKLFIGGAVILLFTVPLRVGYYQNRPQPKYYSTIYQKIDSSTFPSTHAARMTYMASTLWLLLNFYSRLLLLIVTILVCFSRIYQKKHYFIDIIGGISVGLATWSIVQFLL